MTLCPPKVGEEIRRESPPRGRNILGRRLWQAGFTLIRKPLPPENSPMCLSASFCNEERNTIKPHGARMASLLCTNFPLPSVHPTLPRGLPVARADPTGWTLLRARRDLQQVEAGPAPDREHSQGHRNMASSASTLTHYLRILYCVFFNGTVGKQMCVKRGEASKSQPQ